jgi:hypothetical protein
MHPHLRLGGSGSACPSARLPGPAVSTAKPSEGTTITVEAEGRGKDRAAALGQALQGAIMAAVGGLVDSETIVENEQLVKDHVRQLSSGGAFSVVPRLCRRPWWPAKL